MTLEVHKTELPPVVWYHCRGCDVYGVGNTCWCCNQHPATTWELSAFQTKYIESGQYHDFGRP